jgi:hypothetical protein
VVQLRAAVNSTTNLMPNIPIAVAGAEAEEKMKIVEAKNEQNQIPLKNNTFKTDDKITKLIGSILGNNDLFLEETLIETTDGIAKPKKGKVSGSIFYYVKYLFKYCHFRKKIQSRLKKK